MRGRSPPPWSTWRSQEGRLDTYTDAIRSAGIWSVLPAAVVTTALLFAAPAFALVGAHLEGGVQIVVIGVSWLAELCAFVLVGITGLSGTVSSPARRVVGGMAVGLGAALCVIVASCGGLVGASGVPLGFGAGLAGALLAAPLGATWARLRYGADAVQAAVALAWVVGASVVPLSIWGVTWWSTRG